MKSYEDLWSMKSYLEKDIIKKNPSKQVQDGNKNILFIALGS